MGQREQVVRLVKTDTVLGPAPAGEQWEAFFPVDWSRSKCVGRAWRMFKREHPDENPMCWTLEGAYELR